MTRVIITCIAVKQLTKTLIKLKSADGTQLSTGRHFQRTTYVVANFRVLKLETMKSTNPESHVKKRVRLSLADKLDIVNKLTRGVQAPSIMKEYGCCARTVRSIKRRRLQIMEHSRASFTSLNTKTMRSSRFPFIEKNLMDFMTIARAARMPVTDSVLRMKALMLRDVCLQNRNLNEQTKIMLQHFTASEGWVAGFVKRNALRSVSLHGEGGSVNVVEVCSQIFELHKELASYSLENMYNVDETSLFFKLFPEKTYISQHENRKTVRGTKNMKAKDRITAYVCTNASGTLKLPMAVIGYAQKPRCFKLKPPCLPYFSQKNAWSDTKTFKQWYYSVFLPFVRRQTSDKVVLLMDNCGPHGCDLKDCREQVTILTLPPNCTARHQQMDAGIIAAWKLHYKQELLRRILGNREEREALRKAAVNWKAGTKGIDQGYDPHMSDVCGMGLISWESKSEETIARCWLKCDILPPGHEATLLSSHGKVIGTRKLRNDSEYEMLLTLFNELKINLPLSDPLSEDIEDVADGDVFKWANIEETSDVRESVVNDLMEDIEMNMVSLNLLSDDSESDSVSVVGTKEMEAGEVVVPSFEEIIDCFEGVEEMANKSGIEEAVRHLYRAKRALWTAQTAQSRSKRRQTMVNEYFM